MQYIVILYCTYCYVINAYNIHIYKRKHAYIYANRAYPAFCYVIEHILYCTYCYVINANRAYIILHILLCYKRIQYTHI